MEETKNQKTPSEIAESTPTESAERKGRAVLLTGGDQAPVIYTNVAAVTGTPFDIQIIFGDLIASTAETVNARALVRVIMAPEHATALIETLIKRMDHYVATHGALRTKPFGLVESETTDMAEVRGQLRGETAEETKAE